MSLLLKGVGSNNNNPLNPLNTGLRSAYYFNNNVLATKGLQDGVAVNVNYANDTEGKKGLFNGTSSRVYIDPSPDFSFVGDATINIDLTFNVSGNNEYFLANSETTGGDLLSLSFLFTKDIDDKLKIYFISGTTLYLLQGITVCLPGVKYVVIVEKNANNYSFFVNDILQNSLTITTPINVSNYKIAIGGCGEYTGSLFFNGSVSVLRTFNTVLTALQKTELYNSGTGNKFVVTPSVWGNNVVTTQPIDGNSMGYSTFQSNSQRCVVNANGIFEAHLHSTTGGSFLNQTWYLQKSTDGGRTFVNVYTGTCYDQAPIIETDALNNLYLTFVETGTNAKLLIFNSSNYTVPSITTSIPINYASKMCMVLDDVNNKIYFFISKGYFTILNKSGAIIQASTEIVTNSAGYQFMYPSVTLDSVGNVYMAWTTQTTSGAVFYYNIRWMVSRDLGVSWQMANGTAITTPAIADTGGEQVSVAGDLGVQNWLCSWTFVNGRLHAMYWRDGVGQKYVTINPTTAAITNSQNVSTSSNPEPDGVFFRDKTGTFASPTVLFLLTATSNRELITLFKSTDNGVTWTIEASRYQSNKALCYSITGYREQINGFGYGVYTLITARSISYKENDAAYTYFAKLKLT